MSNQGPRFPAQGVAREDGPGPQTAQESAELAAYIADMTAELATLAGRAQLPMLAYFLNLARVEAQIYVRENDVRCLPRGR